MRVPVWVGRADAGRVDATRRLAGSAGGGVADTPPPPTRATAGCMACVGAAAGGRVAGGGASPAGLANMDSGSTATGDRSRTTAPEEAGCVGGDETDATPANFMAGLELAGTATAAGAATSAAGDAPPPCAVASAPDSPPSDMLRVQETRETSAGRRGIAARRSQGCVGKRPKKIELRHGKQFVLSTTPSHFVACQPTPCRILTGIPTAARLWWYKRVHTTWWNQRAVTGMVL